MSILPGDRGNCVSVVISVQLLGRPSYDLYPQVSARGALEPSRTSAHGTMDSFLRQGQKNMLRSVWEVIQVVPLDTPGLFRLWVSIDGSIQQLKVSVKEM